MSEIYRESDRPKLVYICSPYAGDTEKNIMRTREICRRIMTEKYPDVIPIAPHLLFTQFLNDKNPDERKIGLRAGLSLLSFCDELWAFIPDSGPSEGMKEELATARTFRIPITEFSLSANRRSQYWNMNAAPNGSAPKSF